MVRSGVHLPPSPPRGTSYDTAARMVEDLGFDTIWVSDHALLVRDSQSRYPFSEDGRFFLPPDADWYDWTTTLGYLAAATSHIGLGVSVAILPLRHPLLLAKQVATLDRLSGGRITLGAGIGWLEEEYDALDVPFRRRGARMDGGLALLRAGWTGSPEPGAYGPFEVPAGVELHPRPVQARLPILIGGAGEKALERIVTYGDGWAVSTPGGRPDAARLRADVSDLQHRCADSGRDPAGLDIVVRVAGPAREVAEPSYADWLGDLVAAGATSFSFDVSWRESARTSETLEVLRKLMWEMT
ncbi:TIGR03619 family F420-dependent LLM class oxidoreductase [Nocardioides stalactiti]|uniref:TIGR03619 family F420-dependent LLM class oxidoreductase n=1 Tax=Nocardioides stalactiti TaxID=2755356 RepID=UPI0016045065|nr:TIGR03619 family F420-dependent LLM class oxidoreductase [Nocardioides stalactiti]